METSTKIGIMFVILLACALVVAQQVSAVTTDVSISISKETQEGLTKAGINLEKLEVTNLMCLGNVCKIQIKDGIKEIATIQIDKCGKKVFGYCLKTKDAEQLETERNSKIKTILENKAGTSEAKRNTWEKILDAGRLIFK